MIKSLKFRCPNCGDLTEDCRHCTNCNYPLPEQPVGWGNFVILLFLAVLWVFLTHFRWK